MVSCFFCKLSLSMDIFFAIFLIINWLVFQLKIMLSERTCLGCVDRLLDLFELKSFQKMIINLKVFQLFARVHFLSVQIQ